MSLLEPINLNSTLPIPNGSLLKKVDDNTFIEATQADIIALGFTPWGGFPSWSVIAWNTNIVRSWNTWWFWAGTSTFINWIVDQTGTYTFTISWGWDPFNAQYVINWTPTMMLPSSLSFSVNLSLTAGDTIQRQALQWWWFFTTPWPYAMEFDFDYSYFLI